MKSFSKILVLFWKNLLLKRKHWIMTIIELLIPVALFLILALLRGQIDEGVSMTSTGKTYSPLSLLGKLEMSSKSDSFCYGNLTLVYTPSGVIQDKMAADIQRFTQLYCEQRELFTRVDEQFKMTVVENEGQIEQKYKEFRSAEKAGDATHRRVLGGVVFQDTADKLEYQLRYGQDFWETEARTTDVYDRGGGFFGEYVSCQRDGTLLNMDNCVEQKYRLFVTLQQILDFAYIQAVTGTTTLLQNSVENICKLSSMFGDKAMPYPSRDSDFDLFDAIRNFLTPTFTVLSFAFVVPLVLKRIVEEKEEGVKELMKMMGLPSWLHWLGWYLTVSLTCAIIVLIMTLVLVLSEVFPYVNPLILFFTLFLYSLSIISFNFAVSTIFSNPNLAVALGIILQFATWLPVGAISRQKYIWSVGTKMAVALVPNVCLSFAFTLIIGKEMDKSGMTWSAIGRPTSTVDDLTLLHVWTMFLVDCLLYLVVLWYMDNVRPGKYGIAKKFYFPLQKSYWFGDSLNDSELTEGNGRQSDFDVGLFEVEPKEDIGIEIINLRKVFKSFGSKSEFVAVNDVSFNAYMGNITALLGHNGAGKTTTMSILTGLFSPTSGEAYINGFNVRTKQAKARESLGLCPQHNMLFPSLSVIEHLIFFGMLKGLSMSAAKLDGQKYLEMLSLTDKRNVASSSLSGGMKRKLHLAMALTGESKILILDEPTSGMDPEARRGMWDVLQDIRDDRAILLTTHFMEEADVLGDRIVIMADGQVKCSGSPMFLKSNLGSGFTLTVTKESGTSSEQICELVRKYVGEAKVKNENSLELIIELDVKDSQKLPDLAFAMDSNKQELGFSGFGFSKTTIEDVFLKIGDDRIKDPKLLPSKNFYLENEISNSNKLTGLELVSSHLVGLFVKRMVSTIRMWKTYIFLTLFSLAIVILLAVLTNNPAEAERFSVEENSFSSFHDYESTNQFLVDTAVDGNYQTVLDTLITEQKLSTTIEKDDNITMKILEVANKDIVDYSRNFIIGLEVVKDVKEQFFIDPEICNGFDVPSQDMLTIVYNPVPLHSRPLAINILSNIILRSFGKNTNIVMSSKPLVINTFETYSMQEDAINQAAITYSNNLVIAMSLFLGLFIIFPLKERVTNAKQVQIMAGVKPSIFWISNFLWDFLVYMIVSLIILMILYGCDKRNTFSYNNGFGTMLLLMVLLGLAGIPWSYILSFPFRTSPAAYAIMVVSTLITGVVCPLAAYLLRKFYSPKMSTNLAEISDIIRYTASWLGPYFSFGRAVLGFVDVQERNAKCVNLISYDTLSTLCKLFKETPELLGPGQDRKNTDTAACCDTRWNITKELAICGTELEGQVMVEPCLVDKSFWSWDHASGIYIDILILCANIVVFWIILFFIETNIIKFGLIKFKELFHGSKVVPELNLDDDVQEEKDSVHQNANMMKVIDLTKKFGKFDAVRGLTFGVREKECFGLLGINGAGKTTTFRMLTGDEIMTTGEAVIDNVSIKQDKSKYLQSIGYCPQFDSIIEVLTGREMLTLFARIRGLQSGVIQAEVEKLAEFVDLSQYLDRECGKYSGGNKRKLNVSLALIGRPQVMLLDEPTTGVDPAARRKMWETINNIRKAGTSVILTSHSMDECEALCDRLAIMVEGNFRCLGGPQHIKTKFGQGFQIILKLVSKIEARQEEFLNELKASVIEKFEECVVTDEHLDYIHFHVANPSTPWHHLFRTMEVMKKDNLYIQDYSISETSLEQVFLSFARGKESANSGQTV